MAAAFASASNFPSAKALLSTAASLAATAVLVRTVTNDLLPGGLQDYILSSISGLLSRYSTINTVVIEEYRGFTRNHMYRSAEAYLGDRCVSPSSRRVRVSKEEDEPGLEVTADHGEEITDVYQGVAFKWVRVCRSTERAVPRHSRGRYHSYDDGGASELEVRYYEVRFHRKHQEMVMKQYLPYVGEQGEVIRAREKGLKIHTVRFDSHVVYSDNMDVWSAVGLDHPATFETLAMDADQKREIVEDLDRFVARKDFYRRVGKAWKRGYLLYGPPGTGKSSLIAAIANHLHYHIYDLELSQVRNNSFLRKLLLATSSKSILVVEDIDCSIDLKSREGGGTESVDMDGFGRRVEKVTLSGLLNLIDGLWSCCGEERIIIFTTNYKDRLDPALLRPGRMDKHIHMSYCKPQAFRVLVANYFPDAAAPGASEELQPLLAEVDALLADVEVTPAEVAEELMHRKHVEPAIRGLIEFIMAKKEMQTRSEVAHVQQPEPQLELDVALDGLEAQVKEKLENGHVEKGLVLDC